MTTDTTFTTANQQRFFDVYLEELKAEMTKNPKTYLYPIEKASEVARKMVVALAVGKASKESPAVRRTCKHFGIADRYTAIHGFLAMKDPT